MPRVELFFRRLPPAVISKEMLQSIEGCIPEALSERATWYVDFNSTSCDEKTTEKLFEELAYETRFTEVSLEVLYAQDSGHAFIVSCGPDEIWMQYNIPQESESDFKTMARRVEGIFSSHGRWSARVPSLLRLGGFSGAHFRLGGAPTPFLSTLDWNSIAEATIPRVIFGIAGALAVFIAGWVV